MSVNEQEIRQRVLRYCTGRLSVEAFHDWISMAALDVRGTDADSLAAEIELRLAEFSNGDWSESELREHLLPLSTPTYTVVLSSSMAIGASSRDSVKVLEVRPEQRPRFVALTGKPLTVSA